MQEVQKIVRQGESEFPLELLSEARWPGIPSTSLASYWFFVFVCLFLYWVFTHETPNQNSPVSEVRALLCQVSLEFSLSSNCDNVAR